MNAGKIIRECALWAENAAERHPRLLSAVVCTVMALASIWSVAKGICSLF